MSLFARFADKMIGATHMVCMAMSVANVGDWLVGPFAQRIQHTTTKRLQACVKQDQPITCLECHHMRERFDQGNSVAKLRELHCWAVYKTRTFIDVIVDKSL